MENKHDLAMVAKRLGRTEEVCREKLHRLDVTVKNVRNVTYVVFPKPDADLRREFVKDLL